MAFNLKKVLKALLFSSSQPLSVKDIQAVFERYHRQASAPEAPAPAAVPEGAEAAAPAAEVVDAPEELVVAPELYEEVPTFVSAAQIREAMEAISTELTASDDGLVLVDGASGYRLATEPRFARWIRILRQEPPPVKLSQSSLETLAVVAYRQPATRSEIESVRGVSADAGIAKLLERELIAIIGRADLPGRPIQYGTTPRFLEFVGIKSLDELPASDVLSSRQIDEWLKGPTGGHTPNDADMGLEEGELALEQPSAAPPPASESAAS